MNFTDVTCMRPEAQLSTEQLRVAAAKLEAAYNDQGVDSIAPGVHLDGHLTGFSTALTDDDRRYMDLCAELFARGEYRRKTCSDEQ